MANRWDNFVEVESLEDANSIDLDAYTFLDRLSAERGTFCFKIREKVRK